MGTPLILLLPEHMTYQAERELAASMREGKGFLRARVFGFRRFARQVLLEVGGMACPRVTEVGRSLLLKKILNRRRGELKVFGRAAKQRGFSRTLSEAIQELKSYGLRPEDMKKAAEKAEEPRLRGKLEDLALLSEDFQRAMKGRYNDNEDVMDALAQRLPGAKFLRGAEVWVDGFIFFNPQERRVLGELMKLADEIHVSLAMEPDLRSPANLRQTGLFHRSWRTMEELRKMGEELGLSWKVRPLKGFHRGRGEALRQIEGQLFARSFRPVPEAAEGVILAEAAVRRLEVDAAASDILRLCRDKGFRYRDIGILLRDEAYGGLLDFALEEHGIPFFRDAKRSAAHHPLAELLRSAFEALRGWRYEPLFRCLRTGFFPVTWEQLDRLENYVLEFGIRGAGRWLAEEDWRWQRRSPEEAGEGPEERTEKLLTEINFARRQVAAPLASFRQGVRAARTVREMTEALYLFLLELKAPERLMEWADRAEAEGRLDVAEEHRKIWGDVIDLMDQMAELSGGEVMPPGEYADLLGEGLDTLEFSLVPPGLDHVSVASFDQNSLANSRAIYILGANEGIMPRHSKEKGLFTDGERLHLQEAGVELSSGALEGSLAERYLLYRGFTEARDYLWVSWSMADAAGNGVAPSSLVARLRAILPHGERLFLPLEYLLHSEGEEDSLDRVASLRLSNGRHALSGLVSALRRKREGQKMEEWWRDAYNWILEDETLSKARAGILKGIFFRGGEERLSEALARELFANRGRLRGSVTRFECFRKCPFRHFAQYGLKLRERQEYRFQAMDLGTLLHDALREFGEQLKASGRYWRDVSEEECHAMCQSILDRLMPRLRNELLMSTAQYRHQQERICSVAERSIRRLVALDAVSRFHPRVYEQPFGAGAGMNPLVYPLDRGMRVEILGQIDRVDLAESGGYFLVIDYKTGASAINLLEVYHGLRMQLLTYLLAAKVLLEKSEGTEVIPAGMLYFFLKYPMLTAKSKVREEEARKEIEKKLRMPGWILAEEEVIRAIDSSQQFIKVRLKKSGEVYDQDRPRVKTMEEFAVLLDYVDCLLESTGREILSGGIRPEPYRRKGAVPCTYCPYRAVCGFDLQLEGFRYRELEERSDDELMAAMEERGRRNREHGVD